MSQVYARPALLSGRDKFCMCQLVVRGRQGIHQNRRERDVWGNKGDLHLGNTCHKRGSLELNDYSCFSGETSAGMYKVKEAKEKSCSDFLASHQRKCDCALAAMATWRFSSRLKVMKSLLVDTEYKPLQSVQLS
jgi:hypothetical protein